MPTGVVKIGSDLERRKWMREGLIQAAARSFWSPMTGATKDAVAFEREIVKISLVTGQTVKQLGNH